MFTITFDYMLDGIRHSFGFDIIDIIKLLGYAAAGYSALAFVGAIIGFLFVSHDHIRSR
jgi:hypothetical protein